MGKVWPEDAVARNLYTTALSVITALDESPLLEGLLYVGTDDGLLQISEDGGRHWRRVDQVPGLPANSYVTDVFASRRDANTVFATFNNWQRGDFRPHVIRSEDRGRTWTSITTNLPERSGAWSIVQDHVDPDLLFVGLEFGVYFTVDGGKQWTQLRGGIPAMQARDLHIQQRETDLVVGTFGRGTFILDDYTALREVSTQVLAEKAWLFSLRPAYLYNERGYVTAAWGNETNPNPPFGALLTYYVGQPLDDDAQLVLTVTAESGEHIRRLELDAAPGMHRVAWDLRHEPPPPPPEGTRRRGPRRGPLVDTGRYVAALGSLKGDAVMDLALSQTFVVVPLR